MEDWKTNSNNSKNSLLYLIKNCEYHNLSEKQSLELVNTKLTKPISRSTYYKYKKKLFEDRKFQSLKKSIYKSKILKSLLLYLGDRQEHDGYNIQNLVLEKFPEKKDVFEITEEQKEKLERINSRVKSNFSFRVIDNGKFHSNLTRVNKLPKTYTLREEYIRCGKHKNGKCKCKSGKHGPYFYAYWREKLPDQTKSILRKKYLGTIDPRL